MFRPKGESRGLSGFSAARALALVLTAFVFDVAVQAADSGSDAQHRIRIADSRDREFSAEDRAQELYLDALEKLDAGLRGPAQSILGDLLARFPRTQAAVLARHRLEEMSGPAVAKVPAVPTTAAIPPPTKARPVQTSTSVSSGPLWDQELRRNAAIQARLRMDVGDRVFFSPGSAELGSRARAAISAQARWLKRWREFEAAIAGHADESGSQQDDVRLSLERAEAVRRRLVSEGVAPDRLVVVAQGHSQPVAICDAPECRAQNRRVVTLVFVSGTTKRLGLNAGPVVGTLGDVAVAPSGDVQPLQAPVAAEWDGPAR